MGFEFHHFPTLLLLGALVPIFWFLYGSNRSYRVRLWVVAWTLIFLRAAVQVFGPGLGMSVAGVDGVDLATLQLSGLVLLLSMTKIFQDPRQRWPFFLLLAIPSVGYAELYAFHSQAVWAFLLCGLTFGIGAAVWIVVYHRQRLQPYMIVVCVAVLIAAGWGSWRAVQGRPDLGFYSIETLTFGLAGFLYWYCYRRLSPGVVLTSVGLFAWAAVFPVFYLVLPARQSVVNAMIALANIPKFWVAIGMIVTLLEDKSQTAQLAEAQERATREQIQRFFYVTSKLLTGADVAGFCDEIADVITQSSNFRRVVVLLTDDQRNLHVAGASGMDAGTLKVVREEVQHITLARLESLCQSGREVGPHSFRVARELIEDVCSIPASNYPATQLWHDGDKMVVPLRSPRGVLVGCVVLDEPRDVQRIVAEDLAAVEMLSADLAISIENSHLQRQLVVSEKLAGLGKLVSGAGHELNNPLTAVLGYAEMISGSAQDEGTRRGADVIRREALRMKQIIDNLLRFARQTKFERRSMSLSTILDEVFKLRAYEIKRSGVELRTEIAPNLPGVLVDENLLKQVFLNLLNNSLDALHGVEAGRIIVEANQHDGRVRVRFSDNGSGFPNPDRVFDPFFTTKDPGKGPGLGLSVSYGIIKQHGGEISAHNLHPSGASIVIDLPIAASSDPLLEPTRTSEAG
jgi:signal transduction histidine kinase